MRPTQASDVDRDLQALENGALPARVNRALRILDDRNNGPEFELPDADELSHTQFLAGIDRLHEDKSAYPRFNELKSVDELTGPFAPEEVIIVAGDTGDGKSMLCQNLFDDQIEHDVPTLYIGTEQSAEVLMMKQACIRAGVSQRLVLKPRKHELGTELYEDAVHACQREMKVINTEFRGLAFYAACDYVNQRELKKWISGGVREYGIEFVIVDHIDQVDHGSGRNPVSEVTATVQLLHNLAREHRMPIVVASQIKRRSGDPLAKHSPPDAHDLAGAAGKERVMALGLGVWRPLRFGIGVKELREMKKKTAYGLRGQDTIYEPNTMGVRLLKDRLGNCPGQQVFLHVGKGGKLEDDPATTHGIDSGGFR
jgi:archaellum biogenesis ATPase FlaH